jgi:hypothetical protein
MEKKDISESGKYFNPDDDNEFIRRLKLLYQDTSLASVRPSLWSAAMGFSAAGAGGLLIAMGVPMLASASCLLGSLGYGYTWWLFQPVENDPKLVRARREEGYLSGIGTSALVASGNISAFRLAKGASPILLNMLLLNSVSAIYYSGLSFSEGGGGGGGSKRSAQTPLQ